MEFLRNKILFILFVSLLVACDGEILEKLDRNAASGDFCPTSRLPNGLCPNNTEQTITKTWDFSNSADYVFNPNYVEVSSGAASLKVVDTNHAGNDFNGGSHVGTEVSGSKVTLRGKLSPTETHVNIILPGKKASLVGYWRLDGVTNAEVTYGVDGLSSGGSTFDNIDFKVGNESAVFDGTDDTILIETNEDLISNSVSISLWFKTSSSADRKIFSQNNTSNSHSLAIIGGTIRTCSPSCSTGSTVNDYKWHHAVFVGSGAGISVYLDGSSTPEYTIAANSVNLGKKFDLAMDSSIYFPGNIDEVAIYNTALTTSEIQSLYEAQNANYTELNSAWTPQYSSLVGYWKMDGNWQDSIGLAMGVCQETQVSLLMLKLEAKAAFLMELEQG